MSGFTKEQLTKALPTKLKYRISDQFVEKVNQLVTEPELRDQFKENLLSFSVVLAEGKYKLESYLDAVRYVSYKLMSATNVEAYSRTFPDRIKRLTDEGADAKTISSYVAAYHKTQLVQRIFEQTLTPTHVLNAPLYQQAINVQADLMMNARSEKVRSDAAACLIKELKMPETTKVELDIGVKADKTINDLRQTTMELVRQQKAMLEAGHTNIQEVAASKIIEGEVVEAEVIHE